MTTENLVTIDFDSEIANNNNEICVNEKNFHGQEIDFIPDVSFKDHHILEDTEVLVGESQPLLGGGDHDQHQITYNQFPGQ